MKLITYNLKLVRVLSITLSVIGYLLSVSVALAQSASYTFDFRPVMCWLALRGSCDPTPLTFSGLVMMIIDGIINLAFVALTILILYAAILMLIGGASGNSGQIEKSKAILSSSLKGAVGLLIAKGAFLFITGLIGPTT